MRKLCWTLLATMLAGAATGGLGVAAFAAATAGNTYTVHLTDAAPFFSEPSLDIKVGDTVVWVNDGPEKEHIVTDTQMDFFSGPLALKTSWKFKFDFAGTFDVICGQHYYMRSKIVVHNDDGTTERRYEHPYQSAFKEFVIPTRDAVARMIIQSKVDDTMWFTIGGGGFYGFEEFPAQNKIAQVDENGQFIEYSTPTPDSDGSKVGVDSLVMADNGDIWFTERLTNRIGVLRGDGSIKEFQIPTPGGYALGVDFDQKGNLWFAERYGNRIGWITPEGAITEIEMPKPDSEPRTVYVDKRGRVWYTAREANEIGYYDTENKKFVHLIIPTKQARAAGIAEAKDGSIYFVEMVGNKIARIEGNEITEITLPSPFAAPFKIVTDEDGIMWFTEVYGNAIGRFDPATKAITEYKIPTADSRPGGIAVDRKGRIWFIEQRGNKVGFLDPKKLPNARPAPLVKTPPKLPLLPTAQKASLAPAANEEIKNFAIPTPGAHPGSSLVEDKKGRLWFPLMLANKVASYDRKTGQYEEHELPTAISLPASLEIAKNGDIWAAEFRGNRLARIEPDTGTVSEYEVPFSNALPTGVPPDDSGLVWMSLYNANRIVAFNPATRSFRDYEMPRPESSPLSITFDGKQSLWISGANEDNSYIARFDLTTQRFEEIALPAPRAVPVGMLVDNKVLWVALGAAGEIARYDIADKKWTRFAVPGSTSEPARLAKDSAGRIWATDGGGLGSTGGNQLVVVDPASNEVRTIAMTTREAKPIGIAATADGEIWFTQQAANRLSHIVIAQGVSKP